MKQIILIYKDIQLLIRHNILLMLAIVISIIVSNAVFIYGYINTVPYIYSKNDFTNVNFRTYRFYIEDRNQNLTQSMISDTMSFFSSININDILFCDGYIAASSKETSRYIGQTLEGEDSFSGEETDAVVLISSQAATKHIGDQAYMTKNGNKIGYRVVGVFSNWNPYGIIPITNFIDNNYTVDSIIIITTERLNENERTRLHELIKTFPLYQSTDKDLPQFFYDEEMSNSYSSLLLLIFIYFLIIFPYIYIINYMNKDMYYYQRQIHNYYSSKNVFIKRIIIEWELITLGINVFTTAIYYSIYDLILSNLNIIKNITLTYKDFINIFILLSAMTTIVNLIYYICMKNKK